MRRAERLSEEAHPEKREQREAARLSDPALLNFDRLPDSAYVRPAVARALFADASDATWRRWGKRDPDLAPHRIGPNHNGHNVGALRRALAKRRAQAYSLPSHDHPRTEPAPMLPENSRTRTTSLFSDDGRMVPKGAG